MTTNPGELNETPALDTLKPSSVSRAAMISDLLKFFSDMDIGDLSAFHDETVKQVGNEEGASGANAEKNRKSISAKGSPTATIVKEDLDSVFEGTDLSDEVKEKLATIFESAVNIKVSQIEAELVEEFNDALDEEVEAISESLIESVDDYLTEAVAEWANENAIALESGVRTELAESFMEDLRALFIEHQIDVPESEIDIVEELAEENEELRSRLDEAINENIVLSKTLSEAVREELIAEAAAGLTLLDQEKFRVLAEGSEFNGDIDGFIRKLEIIKESVNSAPSKKALPSKKDLTEESAGMLNEEVKKPATSYAAAISELVKR